MLLVKECKAFRASCSSGLVLVLFALPFLSLTVTSCLSLQLFCIPTGADVIRCRDEATSVVSDNAPVHYMTNHFRNRQAYLSYASQCGVPHPVAARSFIMFKGRRRFAALHHLAYLLQLPTYSELASLLTERLSPLHELYGDSLYHKFEQIAAKDTSLIDWLLNLAVKQAVGRKGVPVEDASKTNLLVAMGVCSVTNASGSTRAWLLEPLVLRALYGYCVNNMSNSRKAALARRQDDGCFWKVVLDDDKP